jgi:hypothetical protein
MSTGERGRIPSAIIGVLLLVSATGIAVTDTARPGITDPAVETAFERATAETQTAVRDGTLTASRDAAREPVIEPAATASGQALNDSAPFRDALRLRIYRAVRDRLDAIERNREAVAVTATLPPVESYASPRGAIERVSIEAGDANATTMRVRVQNISLRATRGGQLLTTQEISPTLVVGTPVLALHERVQAYQEQLDAGVTKPGLDQRLTAQLYALTWGRGYAQYGGAPIENVLANRHVAVTTNAGLLATQRATIGVSDSRGRKTVALAAAKVTGNDVLAGLGKSPPTPPGVDLDTTQPPPANIAGLDPPTAPEPDEPMPVGVNDTARSAFEGFLAKGSLNRSIREAYTVRARYVTSVSRVSGGNPSPPGSPGPGWSKESARTSVSITGADATTASPAAPPGWHPLESYGGEITLTRTRRVRWVKGNKTTVTRSSASETVRVAVAVVGDHSVPADMPTRTLANAHTRGRGVLGGPNLADARGAAIERLVTATGGPTAVLARAARGDLDTEPVSITLERPDGISRWVYRDLIGLRHSIAKESVSVERGEVGTFEANPPARLADHLRQERSRLVDPPQRYDSAAHAARVGARAAYVDAVVRSLEAQASAREDQADGIDELLADRDAGSLSSVRDGMAAATSGDAPRQAALTGPTGPVRLRVESAPAYLSLAEVSDQRVPALGQPGYPLVAENVNLVTIPYGDVTESLLGGLFGGQRVRLGSAARTLRAANDTLEESDNARVAAKRDRLLPAVKRGNQYVVHRLVGPLASHGVGTGYSDRRELVSTAMDRWGSEHARALAFANGSATAAVVARANATHSIDPVRRDRLALALDAKRERALQNKRARPSLAVVNESRAATQALATKLTEDLVEQQATRAVGSLANRTFEQTPAGLPLAPPATPWYATTNLWHVTARGEYGRFAVRADRGRPSSPGAGITYVRDGQPVRLDVDGDGTPERLGRASAVSFNVSTTVVIVVPPGKAGVGDRNGVMAERSAGWPQPGPS